MINFPYPDMQQLNLDWIIGRLKAIMKFIPGGGAVGQILRRTSTGAEWSDEQAATAPVSSVNGQTGAVVLDADDVGALPNTYTAPVSSVNGQTGAVSLGKSDVGLGNVDNVQQYSASNPPPYPVTSVNGQTGSVSLNASSVGAIAADAFIRVQTEANTTYTFSCSDKARFILVSTSSAAASKNLAIFNVSALGAVSHSDILAGNVTYDESVANTLKFTPGNAGAVGILVFDGTVTPV